MSFKKYILILFLVQMVFSYSTAFAQNTSNNTYDYSRAGVSDQIKQYLCAPSAVNPQNNSFFAWSQNTNAVNNNENSGDLFKCINTLYKFAIVIASTVGVFFIVIAGYLYIGSEGNQESVERAKSILTSTLTSIVLLLVGFVLLKAINPDLVQFRSIRPNSSFTTGSGTARTPQTPEGSGGGNANIIGTSGACQNCVDYTNFGLVGNSTQRPGENTFLNPALKDKLVRLKSNYINLIINEGYPPTVNHSATCHFDGSCVDIGTSAARTAEEINRFCNAATEAGLEVLNEYPGMATTNCGTGRTTQYGTGGHFHVK